MGKEVVKFKIILYWMMYFFKYYGILNIVITDKLILK